MPQINLGNIKNYSDGAGLYTHSYNNSSKTHNFTGVGVFGYCKCVVDYKAGDKIQVNNIAIPHITMPTYIIKDAWITFIIHDSVFYMLDKAEMFHVPEGELVTPINSPEIWCACAGINWKEIGSPDIETLAASDTYCPILISNANAFAYYRRSNEIIKKTMSNSNIISSIENNIAYYTTPYVTGANTPAGYNATASNAQYTDGWSSKIYGAFANGYYAANNSGKAGSWVSLSIPEPIWPYKMTINPNGVYTTSYMLSNAIFTWQCSEDGSTWIDIASIPNQSTTSNVQYTFYNTNGITGKYKYFRLYVSQSSNTTYWNVGYGKISGIL